MSVALHLYEQLTEAADDKARARAIADAFDQLEVNYPALKDAATRTQLSETELRLRKDIEQVRLETEQVRLEVRETEARLQKEIEQVRNETAKIRLEIKETEARLQKEIELIRREIAQIRLEIKEVEARLEVKIKDVEIRLTRAIHRQTLWVVGSVGAIVALIRFLDWMLAHVSA